MPRSLWRFEFSTAAGGGDHRKRDDRRTGRDGHAHLDEHPRPEL